MDDKYTNEYAALWDKDFVGLWAERIGERRARQFIGMLYKRVGARKAYPALKAAIEQAKRDPRGYAMKVLSE